MRLCVINVVLGRFRSREKLQSARFVRVADSLTWMELLHAATVSLELLLLNMPQSALLASTAHGVHRGQTNAWTAQLGRARLAKLPVWRVQLESSNHCPARPGVVSAAPVHSADERQPHVYNAHMANSKQQLGKLVV